MFLSDHLGATLGITITPPKTFTDGTQALLQWAVPVSWWVPSWLLPTHITCRESDRFQIYVPMTAFLPMCLAMWDSPFELVSPGCIDSQLTVNRGKYTFLICNTLYLVLRHSILTSPWTKRYLLGLITGHGHSENVRPYIENLLAFSSTIAPVDKIFSVKNYILTKAEKALLNCSAESLINLTSQSINLKKCLYKLYLKRKSAPY